MMMPTSTALTFTDYSPIAVIVVTVSASFP